MSGSQMSLKFLLTRFASPTAPKAYWIKMLIEEENTCIWAISIHSFWELQCAVNSLSLICPKQLHSFKIESQLFETYPLIASFVLSINRFFYRKTGNKIRKMDHHKDWTVVWFRQHTFQNWRDGVCQLWISKSVIIFNEMKNQPTFGFSPWTVQKTDLLFLCQGSFCLFWNDTLALRHQDD